MRKITNLAIAFSLLALGVIPSCQSPGSITVDDVSGVWIEDSSGFFLFLNEHGNFSMSTEKRVSIMFGEYQLEGTTMNIQSNKRSNWCPGYSASFQVELLNNKNKLVSTMIEGDCPDWIKGDVATWVRYSP